MPVVHHLRQKYQSPLDLTLPLCSEHHRPFYSSHSSTSPPITNPQPSPPARSKRRHQFTHPSLDQTDSECTKYREGLNSSQHPFRPPLHKLIQQHRQIGQRKPAHIKRKELGGVPRAQLDADLRLVAVPQAGVVDLAGDLVW